eukprot:13912141-Alexandrium_andersonii.AAC.1
MSASLVGSEMCIRDRRQQRTVAQPCTSLRYSALFCTVRLSAVSCAEGLPVSYTHLTLPTICSV